MGQENLVGGGGKVVSILTTGQNLFIGKAAICARNLARSKGEDKLAIRKLITHVLPAFANLTITRINARHRSLSRTTLTFCTR